jgi:hypothetical protein
MWDREPVVKVAELILLCNPDLKFVVNLLHAETLWG